MLKRKLNTRGGAISKGTRLEARLTQEAKALCKRAATLQGRTLTDFVVQSAVEAARRTVRENELVELTEKDKIAFVEALLNPPKPNSKLKKAARRYNQTVKAR